MDVTFDRFELEDHAVLAVSGDVDMHTAPALRQQIAELVAAGNNRVLVDMSGVDFLDSTGLGALLGGLKEIRGGDGRLALVGVNDRVMKVFTITALDTVFDIYPTREAAIAER